jgi:hypothetical protein
MRKTVLTLALASLPALGGPASAEICAIDAVPASTLLVHYFEVELGNDAGFTTLFSINNASAAPTLAHVTLWTDWSIPTIDFDVYLTGFDVQSFNLRDFFTTGLLPQTAPDDDFSNNGLFSLGHVVFPGCAGNLPIGNLPPILITLINEAHTGQPVSFPGFDGDCAGENYGDNVARGYITIDQVDACSTLFPNSPVYFGPGGVAGNDNILWGDVFYVDPGNNFAQGETAVHIESAPEGFFVPGDYTFYGRYVGFTALDQREPLGTTFATRYLTGAGFGGGTDILCWRDSKADPTPVACGSGPPDPMPLSQTQIVIFDEEENPEVPPPPPPISPLPPGQENVVCPLETQRVAVGGPALPTTFDNGWLYLNLNTTTGAPVDPAAQAWVSTIMSAEGQYSIGLDAIQLDSACNPNTIILGEPQ